MNTLLAIWCNQEERDISVFDIAEDPSPTCKYNFLKGQKANTQCKTKVKEDGEYCSNHKPK